ncbi:MAG: epoxyqueuosine reductase [Clostridia bacterium]|nr:epoxyqueuosine reductase [Clostridia bacterium]
MKEFVIKKVSEYVNDYPEKNGTKTVWKKPLIAFASADDERFYHLKTIVSPTHAIPKDFLENAKTVIAYFIPFEQSIARSNVNGTLSSVEWATAYIETNKLIYNINTRMHQEFKKMGYSSVILPATHNFDEEKLISDWSHRHVAVIAGLGDLGLNNMLITESGCCGRLGSIIADMEIEPTINKRIPTCLYKYNQTCGKCLERCTSQALTQQQFNRHQCYEMCLNNSKIHAGLGLADVCGKCLVGLPCSFMNPVKNQ